MGRCSLDGESTKSIPGGQALRVKSLASLPDYSLGLKFVVKDMISASGSCPVAAMMNSYPSGSIILLNSWDKVSL